MTFADGEYHRYQYDTRGFRIKTTSSDGTNEHYQYDKVGNLLVSGNHRLAVDGSNRVTRVIGAPENNESATPLEIEYTQGGNPGKITQGERTVEYGYDTYGRLTMVNDSKRGLSFHGYQVGEPDARVQLDDRTGPVPIKPRGLLAQRYARGEEPVWRGARWIPGQAIFLPPDPTVLGRTDIDYLSAKQRLRWRDVLTRDKVTQRNYNKPSNSVFLPLC